MRWFGDTSNAPHWLREEHPTPVGQACLECDIPIVAGDRGFLLPYHTAEGHSWAVYHRACLIASILPCTGCEHCQPPAKAPERAS